MLRLSIAGQQKLGLQASKLCVICFLESATVLFRHNQLFLTSAVSSGPQLFSIWLAVECHVQLTWNFCRTFSSPKNRFWK